MEKTKEIQIVSEQGNEQTQENIVKASQEDVEPFDKGKTYGGASAIDEESPETSAGSDGIQGQY